MSKILGFILENFDRLTAFDLLLVIVTVLVLVAGCSWVIHWIYQRLTETQDRALTIKDMIITDLKRQLASTSGDAAAAAEQRDAMTASVKELHVALETEKRRAQQAGELNLGLLVYAFNASYAVLFAIQGLLRYGGFANGLVQLFLYEFLDIRDFDDAAPDSIKYYKRFLEMKNRLDGAVHALWPYQEQTHALDLNITFDLVENWERYFPDDAAKELDTVTAEMRAHMESVLEDSKGQRRD